MIGRRAPDTFLLIVTVLLVAVGAVMVFSASSVVGINKYHDATHYLKRELVWIALGIAAAWFGAKLDYGALRKMAPYLLGLAVLMLVAVLLPHVGAVAGGARRWFEFGPISFEPSEFAKLALVIFLAKVFSEREDGARSLSKAGFPAMLWVGVCFALVVIEPDLGTASLFVMTAFVMLFVGGARWWHLGLEVAVAVPALLAFIYSTPYRRDRFTAFWNPWHDPRGAGYHILQSLSGLGSGGLFGVGLGQSRQKFGYLPEQYTDFIYSIIGEELGFMGAAAVLLLFLFLAYRGISIAMKAEDRFGFYLAIGITSIITLQALVNIGVVTASWPVTGVPLPFISYGGTSMVFSLFGIGLLASISRGRTKAALAEEERREGRGANSSHRRRHGRSSIPRAVTSASALRRAR
ncbi:MAG TPA: putative lipid II flippase FtsW [Candidatus Tumulicola sp.]|nr:putative lipid II flippase FtsW [Candidatus Tumulicola sp.]